MSYLRWPPAGAADANKQEIDCEQHWNTCTFHGARRFGRKKENTCRVRKAAAATTATTATTATAATAATTAAAAAAAAAAVGPVDVFISGTVENAGTLVGSRR